MGEGSDTGGGRQMGQAQGADGVSERRQSRGERYDELQGGGRDSDSVSFDQARDGDDLEADQRAHQDRGQSEAEEEQEV